MLRWLPLGLYLHHRHGFLATPPHGPEKRTEQQQKPYTTGQQGRPPAALCCRGLLDTDRRGGNGLGGRLGGRARSQLSQLSILLRQLLLQLLQLQLQLRQALLQLQIFRRLVGQLQIDLALPLGQQLQAFALLRCWLQGSQRRANGPFGSVFSEHG